ncbi:MAG: hypothetical protein IJK02_03590 [Clostridia bacterium]|nr:hypothetical protein [Clostridia bacterium]
MKNNRRLALYAFGHFLIDFSCAFLLYRFVFDAPGRSEILLVYNFCAFALQMPFGLLADRFGRCRVFAALGCAFTAAAWLFRWAPLPLSVSAGIGNALFHIGGGLDALGQSGKKAGRLGIFVSPGAFGLYLGAILGRDETPAVAVPIALLACAAAVLLFCREENPAAETPVLRIKPAGLPVLVTVFLVVCLRSGTGFLFRFGWKSGAWAWIFVLCVALGKALGGVLYDRFGARITATASLCAAAVLFLFSSNPAAGSAAVLCFNMTMPVTLRWAADLLPNAKGFSFGLLTFALFLGFLPAYFGLAVSVSGVLYAVLSIASLALMAPGLRKAGGLSA